MAMLSTMMLYFAALFLILSNYKPLLNKTRTFILNGNKK